MAHLGREQLFAQFGGVGQIAVVGQGDTVGRIHVKGLRVGRSPAPRRGVAHMADTDVAAQALHVMLAEDIAHQTDAFALMKAIVPAGHDAGGVLAPVLQHGQGVVDFHRDIGPAHHSR